MGEQPTAIDRPAAASPREGIAAPRDGAAAPRALTDAPTRRRTSRLRLAALAIVALLPSALKRPCYRLFFGYRVGRRVRVGLTILDARECVIEDDVRIGHLNVVIGVQ